MVKVLGFTAGVLAVVGVTYAITVAALSLAPVGTMPAARPAYESRQALQLLSYPCAVTYAHRGANGKWIQGCAK